MNKLFLFILFLVAGLRAENLQAQHIGGQLSEEATVSILTLGPADPAYTAFGHTAVRLQDPTRNIDHVYNYGTFDYIGSVFYFKFLYGDLNYYLSVVPFEKFKQVNMELGRSIVSQTLNLSQSQINSIASQLEQNILPENRSYRYRFLHQNCITQVRDLLSEQTEISPFPQTGASLLSGSTYREELSAYLSGRPWMQLSINLILGAGADQSLTYREQNFLPNTLHLTLASASPTANHQAVQSSQTIAQAEMQKRDLLLPPMLASLVFFLVVAAITFASLLIGTPNGWLDRILFGLVGLMGTIFAFGSLVSLHEPLHHNWNLFWALPTHLLVAIWVKRISQNRYLRLYFWLTLALNLGVLAAWQAIPQELPLAIIPIVGSLIIRSAFRLYMNTKRTALNRNAKISSHVSSHKMNLQPVKKQ